MRNWYYLLFISCFAHLALASTPLNTTLMIYHEKDLDACPQRILKLSYANKRLHFVPTIYGELKDGKVQAYFYKDRKAKAHVFTAESLERYQQKMLNCISFARAQNIEVYLTPHIDDLKTDGLYRNKINYDPLKKYRGISFFDISFSYLDQLSSFDQSKVYLSLIGEMGRSLNYYMHSYHKMLELLAPKLKLGLSFNFNQMLGDLYTTPDTKISFINQLDFLGVSAYYAIPSKCSASHFEKAAQRFYGRMRDFGMNKPLRLHFTEVGVGGHGGVLKFAELFPHKGVSGKYNSQTDPWKTKTMKRYRYRYHKCLLDMLKTTPTIQAAFLWNSDSWDVQGAYPFSEKYRDEKISKMIEDHNLAK